MVAKRRPSNRIVLVHKGQESSRSFSGGFTIVELLIVVVVIVILSAVIAVAYGNVRSRAEESVVASDIRSAGQHLEVEKIQSGRYPESVTSMPRSGDSSHQYTVSADGDSYCLTVTSGNIAYMRTPSTAPVRGVCDGHRAPGAPAPIVAGGCPSGFIPVPGNPKFGTEDFCVMKYEAKDVGGIAVSQPEGFPWQVGKEKALQAAHAACAGCRLMNMSEWLTIVHNVLNVSSNWSGGSVGSGYVFSGWAADGETGLSSLTSSPNDSDGYFGTGVSHPSRQRRTLALSNGEVIWDIAGNVSEILSDNVTQELYDMTAGLRGTGDSNSLYREWNAVRYPATLVPNLNPAYGTPMASGWTRDNGIGRIGRDEGNSNTAPAGMRIEVGGGGNLLVSAGLLSVFIFRNEEDEYGAAFRATV